MKNLLKNSYEVIITSGSSAIFYGFWGSFIALGLKWGATPSTSGLFVYSSAILFSLIISRGKISRPEPTWLISGLLFSFANFLLFLSMKLTQLSSAYGFVPASIIVFLILTGINYEANSRQIKRIVLSSLIITAGLIVAEMENDLAFNFNAMLLGLVIAILYGAATYIMLRGIHGKILSENFWIMVTETIFFFVIALELKQLVLPESWMLFVLAGAAVSVGLVLELSSFLYASEGASSFYKINLANIISNFDTVFVAIASIIIGSYSVYGIAGLMLIFLGAALMR